MINNIYCVGRNYSEHAKELGNKIESDPVIFSKPNSSLITNEIIRLPSFSQDIHYETELVIKIEKEGFEISKEIASLYYEKVAVGLDLTARDLQTKLKERKLPWLLAKGFKDSCYVTEFVDKRELSNHMNFSMRLNGAIRQEGKIDEMIFDIPTIIEFLSKFIVLKPNDLIFTGTPQGVGQLSHGDEITLYLEQQKMGNLRVE